MADEVLINTASLGQPILAQDSATTKAEKVERHGAVTQGGEIIAPLSPRKRVNPGAEDLESANPAKRVKGVAPVKAE
jgi:tRNA-dihydrouridine synthase 3